LNDDLKKTVIAFIQSNDPTGSLVASIKPASDMQGGTISYNSSAIVLHRAISSLIDEEYIRAYLIVRLVKDLKYPSSCIELEKEYSIGRPKKSKGRIDILVKDKRSSKDSTFLFIEVKPPDKFESHRSMIKGQLFDMAKQEAPVKYLTYYTAEIANDTLRDKTVVIDNERFKDFSEWEKGGAPSFDELPSEYGVARKTLYVKGKADLNISYERADFEALREELHDVLWSGGTMTYPAIFINLVKLFFAKVYDENECSDGEAYGFQIEYKDGNPQPPNEVYDKINGLYNQARLRYLGIPEDEIKDSIGIDREMIPEHSVAYVVNRLQGISLVENKHKDDGDLLGEFFEHIISVEFRGTKGQFLTHPNIVRFILHAIDLPGLGFKTINDETRLPYICDPACGSGTFLIEAMKLLTRSIKADNFTRVRGAKRIRDLVAGLLPSMRENIWAREYIYGIEPNPDLALTTKVNMVLHGDGNLNIFRKDGLLAFENYEFQDRVSVLAKSSAYEMQIYDKPVNEQFDVVVSNPPFSITLDPETKKGLADRFMFASNPNSENLFIERWFQLLRENGRLGVVLPDSVLDTEDNLYIRRMLYRHFEIKAIISLPFLAFKPYTPTKTSLVIARKKTRTEVKQYADAWRAAAREYNSLKKKVEDALKQETLDDTAEKDFTLFLSGFISAEEVAALDAKTIKDTYEDILTDLLNDEDWWVFKQVSAKFDYPIFMAHCDEIGYKISKKQGQLTRPNELFQKDGEGLITLNLKNPESVLDEFLAGNPWAN
jgi:type I restriction enzyme M protein